MLVHGISGEGRQALARLTSRGARAITVSQAAEELGLDRRSAAKRLARWAELGWLRRVRRGLYIPIPMDAETPETWTEDPLFLAVAVWEPCYFTGWTAASQWGLTEQSFQTTVLKTTRRVRTTKAQLLEHRYLVHHCSRQLFSWGLRNEWRGSSRLAFADPARTVIDCLDDPGLCGGIRFATELLASHLGEHPSQLLIDYAQRLGNGAVLKRLGYLLELVGVDDVSLTEGLPRTMSSGVALLDPTRPRGGPRSGRWGLQLNVDVGTIGHS